jgi:hypothetical protein
LPPLSVLYAVALVALVAGLAADHVGASVPLLIAPLAAVVAALARWAGRSAVSSTG